MAGPCMGCNAVLSARTCALRCAQYSSRNARYPFRGMDVCSWATHALHLEVTVSRARWDWEGGEGLLPDVAPQPASQPAPRLPCAVRLTETDRPSPPAPPPPQVYNFDAPGKTRDPSVVIGHFVNLVWAGTTKLGCGHAACPGGMNYVVWCAPSPDELC